MNNWLKRTGTTRIQRVESTVDLVKLALREAVGDETLPVYVALNRELEALVGIVANLVDDAARSHQEELALVGLQHVFEIHTDEEF